MKINSGATGITIFGVTFTNTSSIDVLDALITKGEISRGVINGEWETIAFVPHPETSDASFAATLIFKDKKIFQISIVYTTSDFGVSPELRRFYQDFTGLNDADKIFITSWGKAEYGFSPQSGFDSIVFSFWK